MTSELKVDKISPASGTTGTFGDSGDTYTVPSGATLSIAGTINASSGTTTGFDGTHVKLLSGSASSAANHDFQSFMDTSKYNTYMVQISNLIGLGGATLDFQFLQSDNSVSGAGYYDAMQGYRSGGSAFVNNNENTSEGRLGTALLADNATRVASYLFWIYNNPNSSQFGSSVYGHCWGYRSDFTDYLFTDFTIGFDNSNSCHGFRVHSQNGNSTTFDYAIYGIAK
tara:strand:+ start:68 stop:745 length:678 start_codon:yes stop_codon:yes gene_type:complete